MEFFEQLWNRYPQYQESSLQQRRFKQAQIQPLIEKLPSRGFKVRSLGPSYKGRDIPLVSIGSGKIKLLVWSQMHGDEATATMALFDLFNYLGHGELTEISELLSGVSLYFIPMLNPDGAQTFQRRTSQDIDMNRDALALQCPESRLLKELRDNLNPDFGFNLHDQNIYYTVGATARPATISFLAPAFNEAKDLNPVRKKAMQVIAAMDQCLQSVIPGQVGRYDDAFETRAFGDNIQKWGTSTILIESGGHKDDPEKQFVRRLNFLALVSAIHAIASGSYVDNHVEKYYQIPANQENLNDVLFRGVTVADQVGSYRMDIAIRREEFDFRGEGPLYYRGRVEDSGDLCNKFGYREIQAQNLQYRPGKVYPKRLRDLTEAQKLDGQQLMVEGFTNLLLERLPSQFVSFPLNLANTKALGPWTLKPEQPATFVLTEKGKVRYAVINGFVHEPGHPPDPVAHGWIFRNDPITE